MRYRERDGLPDDKPVAAKLFLVHTGTQDEPVGCLDLQPVRDTEKIHVPEFGLLPITGCIFGDLHIVRAEADLELLAVGESRSGELDRKSVV